MADSAISRVTFYVAAGPVECCDRCSAGIRNVYLVAYRDGAIQRYGSECINKILNGDTSLRGLFNKNVKLLRRYQLTLAAISMPYDAMPRGSEYFGSGLYFIADSEGKDVYTTHWFFHPVYDAEKNTAGGRYVVTDAAAHVAKCQSEIEAGKVWLAAEIARIEGFLARVMRKAMVIPVV